MSPENPPPTVPVPVPVNGDAVLSTADNVAGPTAALVSNNSSLQLDSSTLGNLTTPTEMLKLRDFPSALQNGIWEKFIKARLVRWGAGGGGAPAYRRVNKYVRAFT